MVDLVSVPAPFASVEARHATAPIAAVLVDESTGRHELLVGVQADLAGLTATLYGRDVEAIGRGHVEVTKLSPHRTLAVATLPVSGYDPTAQAPRQFEVTLNVVWSRSGIEPSALEVAGTALVIDLATSRIQRFQAVRRHPFNRYDVRKAVGPGIDMTDGAAGSVVPFVPPDTTEAHQTTAARTTAQAV